MLYSRTSINEERENSKDLSLDATKSDISLDAFSTPLTEYYGLLSRGECLLIGKMRKGNIGRDAPTLRAFLT